VGGISPVGHRTRLDVVVDATATGLERVHVSAGRRGLQMSLAPGDLLAVTGARVAPVARPG
jgi:Cys-tRNA(Pro)/Cys-tRNA(Cys) deacylase